MEKFPTGSLAHIWINVRDGRLVDEDLRRYSQGDINNTVKPTPERGIIPAVPHAGDVLFEKSA